MAYTYTIEHIPSGKLYIGSRSKRRIDILCGYPTSSKVVRALISRDGVESFKKVAISEYDTYLEALQAESTMLVSIPPDERGHFLNVNFSGSCGALIINQTHISITNGNRFMMWPRDIEFPHGWCRGTKVPPPKQKKVYINLETGELEKFPDDSVPIGWVHKTKFDEIAKWYVSKCGLARPPMKWITDGVTDTKIKNTDDIPLGWNVGRSWKNLNPHRGFGNRSNTGRICITDGSARQYIFPGEVVPAGWIKGQPTNENLQKSRKNRKAVVHGGVRYESLTALKNEIGGKMFRKCAKDGFTYDN